MSLDLVIGQGDFRPAARVVVIGWWLPHIFAYCRFIALQSRPSQIIDPQSKRVYLWRKSNTSNKGKTSVRPGPKTFYPR